MLNKEITFIYMDSAEKSIMEPIAAEANKRGYKTKLTKNQFEKCEIGFYCQHINFPQYSKFSVIMLHDIIQQYGNWPDLWLREPWNKYDIGILPSDVWEKNWKKCSKYYYTRPRLGTYKIGWPKADIVKQIDIDSYKKEFCKSHQMDIDKKTILYAPAWENDGKQDEFVKAMLDLDVNILIKQYPATPEVQPQQYLNIMSMYELHKDNPRVTILDPKTNIFEAIIASDVLVSDESSTLAEAAMMAIPSVSVINWMIPDVDPPRLSQCNYDFVTKTKKEDLSKCVQDMIENYSVYKRAIIEERDKNFCNIGATSSMIMDIIDDVVNGSSIRYSSLVASKKEIVPFKRWIRHQGIIWNREVSYNYSKKYKSIGVIWNFLRKIKNIFYHKTLEA